MLFHAASAVGWQLYMSFLNPLFILFFLCFSKCLLMSKRLRVYKFQCTEIN